MAHRFWLLLIFVFILIGSACGGRSPSAPSGGTSSASTASVQGTTVSAIDGQPIPRITVALGNKSAVSDPSGSFHVDNITSGSQSAVLTGTSVVERHTTIMAPVIDPFLVSLIPTSFDLSAFDQMFRSGGAELERWTTAPSLVVLTTVMNYEEGFGSSDEYHATSEQLTDAETSLLIDQLTQALAMFTGNTFTSFASIERERADAGAKVSTGRLGKIVIGRYKGIQGLLNTIGFGRWATDGHGQVTAGAVYLDRDFDKTSELRRLLRTHELGHALGYNHVTTRTSIMNPAIGPDVTPFDQQGAVIAFQRIPGNQTPDNDPTSEVTSPTGGLFGVVPTRTIWSAPQP